MNRKMLKLVREGRYAAEIEISLIDGPDAWAPYLSPEDAKRLDLVRRLLRDGNVAEASRYGRVFELKPVPA
jgi:hypothetical protein